MSTSRICNIISLRTANDIFWGSGVGAIVEHKNVLESVGLQVEFVSGYLKFLN